MFIGKTKIVLVLFFSIFLNSLNSKTVLNINYTNAEKIYFEKNKWEFMDKVFINYVKKEPSIYDDLNFNVAIFCGSITFLFSLLLSIDSRSTKMMANGAFISAITALVVGTIMHAINSNYASNDKLSKVFIWFIKNYNPDLNSNISVNFKKFVPEELHEVFDAMHVEYNNLGEKYLNNRGLNPLYDLINKIKYDVMKEKYRQPDVVYHQSPCYIE